MNADLERFLKVNDWNERLRVELPAIDHVIDLHRGKGALRILDVGCGPGIHLQALARKYPRHQLDGIDIDEARVVHARTAAEKDGLPITYVVGDFMDRSLFPRASYDIIYAIGNSIALIWGCGNVGAVIEKISSMLEPGGYFLFQIQNNDNPKSGFTTSRVIALDGGGEYFTAKRYEPDRNLRVMHVEFITFTRKPETTRFEAVVEPYSWHLIPWPEIAALLERHSFTRVEAWSDYAGTPFDPASSIDLIVLAKKGLGASVLCDGKGMRVPSSAPISDCK